MGNENVQKEKTICLEKEKDRNNNRRLQRKMNGREKFILFQKYIAGDKLPGSYQYALYDSYEINRSTIELLYAVTYGSSLLIGTLAVLLADR